MKVIIDDEDNLLRRVIFTNPSFVRPDQTLTSFAFTPRRIDGVQENLSVDLEKLTSHKGSIKDISNYRLYALTAGEVRQIGLHCEHTPVEGNYAHALIMGDISKSVAKQLSIRARRIPFPE